MIKLYALTPRYKAVKQKGRNPITLGKRPLFLLDYKIVIKNKHENRHACGAVKSGIGHRRIFIVVNNIIFVIIFS